MNKFFLEPPTQFSKSLLWDLQRGAYQKFGPSAWSEKGVPFYLTSCPFTAKAYFEIVKGFYADLKEKSLITLFDLGCGTGRFAYYFLKEWQKEKPFPLKYVLVDIVEENLLFCKSHPLLSSFVKEGVIETSKTSYEVDTPVVFVANYFFDTIPQDLFRVKNRVLEEGSVALITEEQVVDRQDPELIQKVSLEFSFKPYLGGYRNKKWDLLLKNLSRDLEGKTFLFPVGALKCIDEALNMTKKEILFLAADQTLPTLNDHLVAEDPKITVHSTFSIAVSYYILEMYFDRAFLSPFSSKEFTVIAGLLRKQENFSHLQSAFLNTIQEFDPLAYLQFVERLEKCPLSFSDWINLIRLGDFDPMTFNVNFKKIRHVLKETEKETLKILIPKMELVLRGLFENIYPLSNEEGHVIMNLGVIAFEMGLKQEAKFYFEEAKKLLPDNKELLANLSLT